MRIKCGGKSARSEREEMSARRTSRRAKRSIDYRQFSDYCLSDDDDDFESSSKKTAKTEQKGSTQSAASVTNQPEKQSSRNTVDNGGPAVKKARQSRDERKFDKDTERALRESVAETSSQDSPTDSERDSEYKPAQEEEEEDEYAGGEPISSDTDFSDLSSPVKTGKKRKTPDSGKNVTKNTKQKSVAVRKKAVGVTTKSVKQTLPSKKATPLHSPCILKSDISSTESVSRSTPGTSCRSTTPGLGMRRMPKWTPPGPASRENHGNQSNRDKIGGTLLIRVGLSRNARVKPLHSSTLNCK